MAAVVTGYGSQSSPVNRPWPPGVQKVSDESPPLSPEDALKTFYMAPGYRVELVAAEPLIQEPVAIDWDLDGRLWAVEMPGFMRDVAGSDEHDPVGRVVVLEDTNRDGRMDKRTVFADGLVLARAVKVLDRGVLVGEPPNAWLMRDTNGDLRMDTKELVTAEYGRRDVDPENNANGFYWALDNRMHTAGQVDVYLRLKNGTFEVHKHAAARRVGRDAGRRGPHLPQHERIGAARRSRSDPLLRAQSEPAPHPRKLRAAGQRQPRPERRLARAPESRHQSGVSDRHRSPRRHAGEVHDRLRAAGVPRRPAAGGSLRQRLCRRAGRQPGEPHHPERRLARRCGARKAYDVGEFLASTDERFRPVYLSNAPDGTLYIADLYRGILQHRVSLTVYLRDYILARKLEKPAGLGRIYRVVHETTRRDNAAALSAASPAQLVEALSHPNGWWRETAQRLLVERGEKSAVPALVKLAEGAKDWRTRLHALWTLDGIDSIERSTVTKALEDASRDVRASAIRIAERWLGEAGDPIQAAVLKRLDDDDWAVRQQLAASLGALPPGPRESAVVALLERHGERSDRDGCRPERGARQRSAGPREAAAGTTEQTVQRESAIVMLAAMIVRGAQDAAIQHLFASVADEGRPSWQRSALLRGAEVALLGAAMPGTPTGGGRGAAATPAAALPCPTCPGGRAGPGGAYAFPAPSARGAGGGGRGGGTGPAAESRAGGAVGVGRARRRSRTARRNAAGARGVAGQARRGARRSRR